MRKFLSDFQASIRLADGGLEITLASEERDPTVRELHAGERVLLLSPGELMAIAIVREPEHVQVPGGEYTFWSALVARPEDIVDLPLTEPYAGFPVGYDGREFWAELDARRAQLEAGSHQTPHGS